jgi:predicted HTH transcriptional regulator
MKSATIVTQGDYASARDSVTEYLSSHAVITNRVLRTLTAITYDQAIFALNRMSREGILERRGRGGGSHYVLARNPVSDAAGHTTRAASPSPSRYDAVRSRVVEYLSSRRIITNRALRELTTVSYQEATATLRQMCEEGLLERRGRAGAVHYVFVHSIGEIESEDVCPKG